MRVLITDTALTPYAHAYYKKLALSGCDIFLLLPEKSDTGQNVREYEGSEIPYRIGYSQVRKMWYGKNGMVSLRKFLIKEIPDVLVLTWPYYIDLYFNRRIIHIMAQRKIRLVIREIPFQLPRFGELDYFVRCPSYDEDLNLLSRGFLFRFRAWLTMYIRRFVYRKADAYIGYYSHARDILESYGLRKDAFFYGNTTDTDLLLSIRKRLECIPPLLLILAFSLIVKEYQDCELVIVGEGPEKGILSRMAVNLGLSDKILFTGAIYDPMELGQYMRGASLYVLAGMGGLSINDAMCFSLPIICSVCDGTERDLVIDGVNGYFFKENDVVDLSQKMYLILSNPPMAEEMGKKSLQIIMERANIDTFTKMYRSALDYAMQADAN